MTDRARQHPFTLTRDAYDARADHRTRTIHMSLTQVSIERVVQGMKMCIAVPVAAYGTLKIRALAPHGSATLTLTHADPDLNVVLAGGDATEVTIAAKAWAAVLEKPILVEAGATMMPAAARRTKHEKPSRRSRFARRRHVGSPARMATHFRGEHEIIARN